jgi:hypothetical protein
MNGMVKHLLLLLGMADGAKVADIKKHYARLLDRLSKRDSLPQSVHDDLQPARQRLSESYEHWKKIGAVDGDSVYDALNTTPKLGQVLVASDILSLGEVIAVLKLQEEAPGQRFGELLVQTGFITVEELDYFLQLQRIIELPLDHPERWGQRLVELGLISQDQLKVALIEHRREGNTLRSAIINRGWLTSEVLDRIF